jgi:hypothetical protein
VIDMHPESDFKAKLNHNDDDYVQQFADFWRALAKHYSSWDADRLFFEVLNEPEFRDRNLWAGVQAKLVAAIRDGAPKHTIIAAGANWSSDDELVVMETLRDPNVIYNFHFYEPFSVHSSRRRLDFLQRALDTGAALSLDTRVSSGGCRNRARPALSPANYPLRSGPLERRAHGSGSQSGGRMGQAARRAGGLQ